MLMKELISQTNQAYERLSMIDEVQKAKDADFEMRAKAYKEANLMSHLAILSFEHRIAKAKRLGFVTNDLTEFVTTLMGEAPTKRSGENYYQSYEYLYNHLTNEVMLEEAMYVPRWTFQCVSGAWRSRENKYIVQKRCLNDLLEPVPYGIVLRIQELKALKIFNVFSVLAPQGAFRERPIYNTDPIVLGEIWEQRHVNNGKSALFFIARWDKKD